MKLTLEIEGREPSQRGEEHSHGTCRYLGEDNMGHMGLTLWALTKVTGTKDELKKTESPLFLLLATC